MSLLFWKSSDLSYKQHRTAQVLEGFRTKHLRRALELSFHAAARPIVALTEVYLNILHSIGILTRIRPPTLSRSLLELKFEFTFKTLKPSWQSHQNVFKCYLPLPRLALVRVSPPCHWCCQNMWAMTETPSFTRENRKASLCNHASAGLRTSGRRPPVHIEQLSPSRCQNCGMHGVEWWVSDSDINKMP
eukprot:3077924-Amphidinium_carterae.1